MFATLALVPAAIGVVAPAGPDEGCPSARQVTEALGARLPGTVIPVGQPMGASALRLTVSTETSGLTRVDLADPGGEMLLRRTLAAPERTRSGDCPALADTVALIVERYWREVGFDVPPLPPPRPPAPPLAVPVATGPPVEERRVGDANAPPASASIWSVAAAIGGRAGDTGNLDAAAAIALGLERSWGLRISAGVSSSATAAGSVGTATFRRFPFRLGGYRPLRLGVGQLEPGVGIGLEVISVGLTDVKLDTRLQATDLCSGRFCMSPGADISLGWSVRSARHFYLRALTRAGLAVPFTFASGPDGQLWSTPRTYLEVGIESGVWFN